MAEVYLGHDELLDRPVAIKVLFAQLAHDPSFVERFRREARSAAVLNHPNIVSVYDFGEDPEGYFIVMEYIAGRALNEVISTEGPLAPARAIGVAADIAAALAAAHREGIVHRDVKPANVLIDDGRVKVADFGIAQAANAPNRLTMPGAVIGTSRYLSPEQAQGVAVDERSDVYSLGMVLYEMLTARPPFDGDNPLAIAYKQQHDTPAPPSTANPAVSPPLDDLVAKTLSLDPAERPQTADALRAELLAIANPSAHMAATVGFSLPPATAGGSTPGVAAGAAETPVAGVAAVGAASLGAASLGAASAGAASVGAASTAMLPLAPRAAPAAPSRPDSPFGSPPPAPTRREFRRRRLVVVGVLAVLILAGVLAVTLGGGGGGGGGRATVPPVIGLVVADATSQVNNAGLRPVVVEQNQPGAAGHVIGQLPAPGTKVARSTDVSLFVPATTTTTPRSTTRPTTRTTVTTTPSTTVEATTTPSTEITIPETTVVATTVP